MDKYERERWEQRIKDAGEGGVVTGIVGTIAVEILIACLVVWGSAIQQQQQQATSICSAHGGVVSSSPTVSMDGYVTCTIQTRDDTGAVTITEKLYKR